MQPYRRTRGRALGIAGLMSLGWAAGPAAAGQACTPAWSDAFPGADPNSGVHSLIFFDEDGPGPGAAALFAGGTFLTAGAAPVNHVARWDGSSWSALGTGFNDPVNALVAFDDDGPGPNPAALYAAGEFAMAGGVPANRIARWDGVSWSPLGSGLTDGGFADAHALAVFDDDGAGPNLPALYAGGLFSVAGGIPANRIAKWDGTTWSTVGSGVNGLVLALTVFDEDDAGPDLPRLFATGGFTSAGAVPALYIARWDGASWSAPGSGLSDFGTSLVVHDEDGAGPEAPSLFVGGGFFSAGGISSPGVARWDGSSWSAAGGGALQTLALVSFDEDGGGPQEPVLVAGGTFFSAGGVPATFIASFDGTAWSALGSGTDNWVRSLAAIDEDGDGPGTPALIAGGDFITAGGIDANHIARWDGAAWSAFSPPSGLNDLVFAVRELDLDGDGPGAPVIVAGGIFSSADGAPVGHIARWDGTSWSGLGVGLGTASAFEVRALQVFDEDGAGPNPAPLFAGGFFHTIGGLAPVNYLGRFDGTSWTELGLGIGGPVYALAIYDPDGAGPIVPGLYAGGSFASAGGAPASNVARWNGTAWSPLGAGVGGPVRAITVFDRDGPGPAPPVLVAGGEFITAGGITSPRIAQWNGTSWSTLGAGMNHHVHALSTWDADGSGPGNAVLVAGGQFGVAGGVIVNGIATWNGLAWSALASGMNNLVRALSSFDEDGPGPGTPALFASGDFTHSSGVPTGYVARWNGSSWSALAGGMSAPGRALRAVDDPDAPIPLALFAGGFFTAAGGVSSTYIGAWIGCPPAPPCPWDCDGGGDGIVDVIDLLALLGQYDPMAPGDCAGGSCDYNGDGCVDVVDLLELLAHYDPTGVGCP